MIYVEGDLFDGGVKNIVHGCNARGGFGSGFAKQVKDRYPLARDLYVKTFRESGLKLGQVIVWKGEGNEPNILHCITQENYGPGDKVYVSYDAVRECMKKIEVAAKKHNELKKGFLFDYPTISMPMIGAGLAGGDWNVIESIINEEIKTIEVKVFTFDRVMSMRS